MSQIEKNEKGEKLEALHFDSELQKISTLDPAAADNVNAAVGIHTVEAAKAGTDAQHNMTIKDALRR